MTKPADRRAAVGKGGVLQADTGRDQPFPSTALQSLETGCRKNHSAGHPTTTGLSQTYMQTAPSCGRGAAGRGMFDV